jgi:ribosomal protein L37AE/L43A
MRNGLKQKRAGGGAHKAKRRKANMGGLVSMSFDVSLIADIKIEDYACPKCGSKDLELVGRRTLRCKKCGTIFTIRTYVSEEYWIVWPFFWFFPFVWWKTKD